MNARLILFLGLLLHFCTVNNCIAQITAAPVDKFEIYRPGQFNLSGGTAPTLLYGAGNLLPLKGREKILSDTTGKAVLIASNGYVMVYKLPIDNMSCILPGKYFHSNMPTMKQRLGDLKGNSIIPNPFKKEDLIPGNN
jgi:hypothetical protein